MLVVNTARSTKIDELDDGVLLVLEVDILGLDVSVSDKTPMQNIDGLCQLYQKSHDELALHSASPTFPSLL